MQEAVESIIEFEFPNHTYFSPRGFYVTMHSLNSGITFSSLPFMIIDFITLFFFIVMQKLCHYVSVT